MSSQHWKLIESRHRKLGLNMTNRYTHLRVQCKQKARHINILYFVEGFYLIPKEL